METHGLCGTGPGIIPPVDLTASASPPPRPLSPSQTQAHHCSSILPPHFQPPPPPLTAATAVILPC